MSSITINPQFVVIKSSRLPDYLLNQRQHLQIILKEIDDRKQVYR